MYSVSDLKKDLIINRGGVPYKIVEFQHTKQARGGAIVRTKLKNLLDSSLVSETFKGNDKIESAAVERVDMQYLYRQSGNVILMNLTTYDQITVPAELVGQSLQYLPEGSNVIALTFKNRVIDIEPPPKVSLAVTETEPGLQGDTAKAALKPATLETGARVQVPLFIKNGDRVVIDSRNGGYLERG